MKKFKIIGIVLLGLVFTLLLVNTSKVSADEKSVVDSLAEQMENRATDNQELRVQYKQIEERMKRNTNDWLALDTLRDNECVRIDFANEHCSK